MRGAGTKWHGLPLRMAEELSRRSMKDHQQLEAGMIHCDALYRWAFGSQCVGQGRPVERKA
ncbi:hypothetical protein K3723_09655 [Leisingera caerulea]|uniref:hypothetical protein n=1 Tax=Leisingera caerulea TaxID=506591 RepID=UPI0021A3B7AE|nr:hypothetical protein [Leisingera caerulea]UWQ61164.1 hypothetical protein K3723_09655 [Leisingera caerulea]